LDGSEESCLAASAPQCGQNFSPINIIPKHFGQATVANRAPQCSQSGASLVTAAPQFGQLNVPMVIKIEG
jgi:hypothetical protein